MNRLISLLVTIFLVQTISFANPIDRKKALKLASEIIDLDRSELRSIESSSNQNDYYIFIGKNNKGFAIISGTDSLNPILAYTKNGQINKKQLPPQLKELLKKYQEREKFIRQGQIVDELRATKPFMIKPQIIIEPLVKSKWGQDIPYNELLPNIYDGKRAVTGCIATATAQVMNYHQWPIKGTGSKTYTTKTHKKELSIRFKDSSYQWNEMRSRYSWKYLERFDGSREIIRYYKDNEAKAVAKLMLDIAVACEMDFDPISSASSTYISFSAMQKHFDYSTQILERNACRGDKFREVIFRELNAKRPLILTGASSSIGHAWVIDGYDENGYLHCNWGWNGMADGFFSLNFMVPSQGGIGAGGGNYNYDQTLVVAIPNKEHVQNPIKDEAKLSFFKDGHLKYLAPRICDKTEVRVQLSNFGNFSVPLFSGNLAIGIFNANGTCIRKLMNHRLNKALAISQFFPEYSIFDLNINNLIDGIYTIQAIASYKGAEFQPLEKGNKIKIQVSGNQVIKTFDSSERRFRFLEVPKLKSTAFKDETIKLDFNIENLSNQETDAQVWLMIRHIKKDKAFKYKLPREFFYGFDHKKLSALFSLKNIPVGRYELNLIISYSEKIKNSFGEEKVINNQVSVENPFGTTVFTVHDPQTTSFLMCNAIDLREGEDEVKSYHISPKNQKDYKLSIFTLIENKGTSTFNGKFIYRLINNEDHSSIDLGSSKSININQGEEKGIHAQLDFSNQKFKDGSYELHLVAQEEKSIFDVWNYKLNRYYFITEGFEPNKKEEEDKPTALKDIKCSVKVFPIPCNNFLTIEGEYESFALYNLQGACIFKGNKNLKSINSLDTTLLSEGYYILKIRSKKGNQSIKIKKENK